MTPPSPRRSLGQAFAYARDGLRHAARTQRAFRIQLVLAAGIGGVLVWLHPPPPHIAGVVLAMTIVLVAELFNTAVEIVIDLLVERNRHQLAKAAKDVAAGAVVVASVGAALVGTLLLGPALGEAMGLDAAAAGRIARLAAFAVGLAGVAVLVRFGRRAASGGVRSEPPAQG